MKTQKIKYIIYDPQELTEMKVVVNNAAGTIKLKYGRGYTESLVGEVACELDDNGDNVVISFNAMQDTIVLDYAELDYMRKILNAWDKHMNTFPTQEEIFYKKS